MITKCLTSVINEDFLSKQRILTDYKNELERLPKGSIHIKYVNGHPCHYHYTPSKIPKQKGRLVYIGRDKTNLMTLLCRRRFIEMSIPILQNIMSLEECFLNSYSDYNPKEIIDSMPNAYRNNSIGSLINNCDKAYAEWLSEPYPRSTMYLDQLIYASPNKIKVRSKSELIIASELEMAGIPYRYEAALLLEDRTFYPDFTILSPKSNQILYWEHFGMTDNPEYANSMNEKLSIYRRNKIVPWHNLIETYEMEGIPFDAHLIRKIIHHLFLP